MTGRPFALWSGWFLLISAVLAVPYRAVTPARAQLATASRLDEATLARQVRDRLRAQGPGVEAGLWLGGAGGEPWFEVGSTQARPTASAIKAFYLVELFDAHHEGLDRPLPGADAILGDDRHPAISHFAPEVRDEIRRGLGGATVRRVGEVMVGRAKASNAVYNAAANLATAILGGPEALSERIGKRDPAFAGVAVRRYMLRDRKTPGDNEAPAAALAALHRRLASRRLAGVDAGTLEAIRAALLGERDPNLGAHYWKGGALASNPLTEVRAGWWDTPRGPLVYVVMLSQPAPGPEGREATSKGLAKAADAIAKMLTLAGRAARR